MTSPSPQVNRRLNMATRIRLHKRRRRLTLTSRHLIQSQNSRSRPSQVSSHRRSRHSRRPSRSISSPIKRTPPLPRLQIRQSIIQPHTTSQHQVSKYTYRGKPSHPLRSTNIQHPLQGRINRRRRRRISRNIRRTCNHHMTRLITRGARTMHMHHSSLQRKRIRQILRRRRLLRTRIRRKARIRSRRSTRHQRSHQSVSMTSRLRAANTISLHNLMRKRIRQARHHRVSSTIPARILPRLTSPMSQHRRPQLTRRINTQRRTPSRTHTQQRRSISRQRSRSHQSRIQRVHRHLRRPLSLQQQSLISRRHRRSQNSRPRSRHPRTSPRHISRSIRRRTQPRRLLRVPRPHRPTTRRALSQVRVVRHRAGAMRQRMHRRASRRRHQRHRRPRHTMPARVAPRPRQRQHKADHRHIVRRFALFRRERGGSFPHHPTHRTGTQQAKQPTRTATRPLRRFFI